MFATFSIASAQFGKIAPQFGEKKPGQGIEVVQSGTPNINSGLKKGSQNGTNSGPGTGTNTTKFSALA